MSLIPFRSAQTIMITASTTAVSGSFTAKGPAVVVTNPTSYIAFVDLTGNAATTSSFPVLPGQKVLLSGGTTTPSISVIFPTGSGNVYASIGNGTSI